MAIAPGVAPAHVSYVMVWVLWLNVFLGLYVYIVKAEAQAHAEYAVDAAVCGLVS